MTPRVMGIVNVTPDSFSDGGRLASVEAHRPPSEKLSGVTLTMPMTRGMDGTFSLSSAGAGSLRVSASRPGA